MYKFTANKDFKGREEGSVKEFFEGQAYSTEDLDFLIAAGEYVTVDNSDLIVEESEILLEEIETSEPEVLETTEDTSKLETSNSRSKKTKKEGA